MKICIIFDESTSNITHQDLNQIFEMLIKQPNEFFTKWTRTVTNSRARKFVK